MASLVRGFLTRVTRRKNIDFKTSERHTLARILSTLDLTGLGVASTLGSGTYIIAGQVARYPSGPAVIVSFLVAGVASILAGLCYAEFGARVPRAGSAYIYSYVTVGELWAFVIGWNLILEYVIGTASIARAFTPYIDSLSGNILSTFFREYVPINLSTLSEYADLLAFTLTILFTLLLCLGVKESTVINNIFTVVNLAVIAYVIICGLFKVDAHNWNIPLKEIPSKFLNVTIYPNQGGFFPYGVAGMIQGSATCFYAFVGFDVIATTGEEVINPQKAIPIAILSCLTICGLCYIGVSSVLTLMVPYFSLDKDAPLPNAFTAVGWQIAVYFIAVGALASFGTCLLTTMFPMPRIIFAMSRDGLLFKFLAHINHRFKTPDYATIVSGLLAAVMATLFDLSELVAMMSIGTLLAYTLVAACVLILRYEYNPSDYVSIQEESPSCLQRKQEPTPMTALLVRVATFVVALLTIITGVLEITLIDYIEKAKWWAIVILAIPVVLLIATVIFIAVQPQATNALPFRVPFVPLLPVVSIAMNIYLMLKLNTNTWIRFGVWMFVGFLIYFGYGIRHGGDHTTMHASIDVEDEDEEGNEEEERRRRESMSSSGHMHQSADVVVSNAGRYSPDESSSLLSKPVRS